MTPELLLRAVTYIRTHAAPGTYNAEAEAYMEGMHDILCYLLTGEASSILQALIHDTAHAEAQGLLPRHEKEAPHESR